MHINPHKLTLTFFGLVLNTVFEPSSLTSSSFLFWSGFGRIQKCWAGVTVVLEKGELFGTAGGSPRCHRGLLAHLVNHYYADLKKIVTRTWLYLASNIGSAPPSGLRPDMTDCTQREKGVLFLSLHNFCSMAWVFMLQYLIDWEEGGKGWSRW